MDKIKPYLEIAQKYHFWIVSGVVLLVCIVSWFMAASNLQAEFTTKKTEIDGKFSAVQQVKSKADHPNPRVTEGYKAAEVVQAANVFGAWDTRFLEQLKVPQWPRDVYDDDFVDHVESIGPDAEIRPDMRLRYRDYIRDQFPKLYKIINLREWKPIQGQPMPPGGGGLQEQGEWQGLVAWSAEDRAAFENKYLWRSRPTTRQVRYANEDLYVYNALLKVIAETNKDDKGEPIKEHLQAAVKKIEMLAIGRDVPPPEQIFQLSTPGGEGGISASGGGGEGATPDGGAANQQGGEGAPGGAAGIGGLGGEGGAADLDAAIDAQIKHGRYVDSKGTPLAASAPEPYAEFRIMPFQMNLFMDQRKIPQLLVNCANSPLPIEVRQVSIVTGATVKVDSGGGGGGEGGGGLGPGGLGPGGLGPGGLGPGGVGPGGFGKGGAGSPDGGGGFGGGRGPGGLGPGGLGPGGLGPGGLGPGGLGPGGLGPGGLGPGGGRGPGGFGQGDPNQPQINAEVEPRRFDLQVQVRGVIYIFNKPDKTKFLKGSGDAPQADPNQQQPPPDAANPGNPPAPAGPAGNGGAPAAPAGGAQGNNAGSLPPPTDPQGGNTGGANTPAAPPANNNPPGANNPGGNPPANPAGG